MWRTVQQDFKMLKLGKRWPSAEQDGGESSQVQPKEWDNWTMNEEEKKEDEFLT